MKTRVGTLELRVPRVRSGSFSTELFDRYQRSEQALILALMEMVINGVSTRKVRRITEELCGTSFSKSTVSELCKALDPVVSEWNERTLKDKRFPFVIVDAMQLKIRQGGPCGPAERLDRRGRERGRVSRGAWADDWRQRVGGHVVGVLPLVDRAWAARCGPGGLRSPRRIGQRCQASLSGRCVATLPGAFHAQHPGCLSEAVSRRIEGEAAAHVQRTGHQDGTQST